MNIGKVPENVLKRSILKQLKTKREEVLVGAGVGEDCAVLQLKEDEVFVFSTDPITGTTCDIGALAIHVTMNDIATSGAEPVGVLLSVLLPPSVNEEEIRGMMQQVEETCRELNVQTVGGHTEITDAVTRPIITVTGIGKAKKDAVLKTGAAKPGQDVVISKWIALEGTSIIAKEKEEELLTKFAAPFIKEAQDFDRYLSILPEAATAVKSGVVAMHDVTEGGIFGALWEIAESAGVGLTIDLKAIPIKQESVEICEFFDINPYELISSGSLLMIAEDGPELVERLTEQGIHAACIGHTTATNDRILLNDGEKRFLEPPKTDELYKVMK